MRRVRLIVCILRFASLTHSPPSPENMKTGDRVVAMASRRENSHFIVTFLPYRASLYNLQWCRALGADGV